MFLVLSLVSSGSLVKAGAWAASPGASEISFHANVRAPLAGVRHGDGAVDAVVSCAFCRPRIATPTPRAATLSPPGRDREVAGRPRNNGARARVDVLFFHGRSIDGSNSAPIGAARPRMARGAQSRSIQQIVIGRASETCRRPALHLPSMTLARALPVERAGTRPQPTPGDLASIASQP
jgi:hypothetical protein